METNRNHKQQPAGQRQARIELEAWLVRAATVIADAERDQTATAYENTLAAYRIGAAL